MADETATAKMSDPKKPSKSTRQRRRKAEVSVSWKLTKDKLQGLILEMPLFDETWDWETRDEGSEFCGPGTYYISRKNQVEAAFETINENFVPKRRQDYYHCFVGFFGKEMSRDGELSYLVISTLPGYTWIFDTEQLPRSSWELGMSKFLSDPYTEKLVFDGKHGSDLLYHHYNITFRGMLDLKAMEAMERTKLTVYKSLPRDQDNKLVRDMFFDLEEMLHCYSNDREMKRVLSTPVSASHWNTRPDGIPHSDCLQWITSYQRFLVRIWSKFDWDEGRLRKKDYLWWVSSERYCSLLADKEERSYDRYETSDIIPNHVLCQVDWDYPLGIIRCGKCSRDLPTREFAKEMILKLTPTICLTCLRISAYKGKKRVLAGDENGEVKDWKSQSTFRKSVSVKADTDEEEIF